MTVEQWLNRAVAALQESGVPSARLDALILLEDVTEHDRAWLLAHPEAKLATEQLHELADRLERRLQHEPLAYIRGHAEFYGREFNINEAVLVPRPETEDMIDLLKELAPADSPVADIGTGSGALAVTAALETGAEVAATDVDPACLQLAERNAKRHNASLTFVTGSLLEPFLQHSGNFMPAVLLANLPYVPDDYPINQAAKHEPALALFGGPDGLDLYRQMFAQTLELAHKPSLILCESLASQHAALAAIAAGNGYSLQTTTGLIQAFAATASQTALSR